MSIQTSIAMVIFLMLMAVTIVSALAVRSHFNTQSQEAFQDVVEGALVVLQEDINENMAELRAIQGLFNSTGDVSRNEFETFVSLFFDTKHGTQALEWIPRVPREQGDQFVQNVRKEGFDDFSIHPDSELADYFPVTYVVPAEPNLPAFGFDLATNPVRRAALERARDTGELVATGPITLVQETGTQSGFLVFAPVYSKGVVPLTLPERRDQLKGFGLAVFRVDDFIDSAIPAFTHSKFNLKVKDSAEGEPATSIHSDNAAHPSLLDEDAVSIARTVIVAGRRWELQFSAPSGFGISASSRFMWVSVLGVGGVLSALTLGFSYLLLNGRNRAVAFAENMNRSLIESETQRDHMFEQSQDLIITVDREGRFVFVSGAARAILGREPSEMLGTSWQDHIHVDDRDKASSAMLEAFQGHHLDALDIRFIRLDGGIVWLNWNCQVVPGPVDIVFAVGRDITERREMDRMKDEFISVASHELRTPVTSIKGFLELLVEEESGPLTQEQRLFLEAANRNTVRLERLVNDLLDVSRLDAETITLDRVTFDLMEVVRQVTSEMESEIDAKSVKIRTATGAQEIEIDADRSRTAQILTNLISNAVKYSPHGSSVDIELISLPDRNFVQVNIRDYGPGVADEDKEKLFHKFFRADNSTTRSTAGTGLGLAITKALVELQGGKIWVDSEWEKGSTFCFTVPSPSGIEP